MSNRSTIMKLYEAVNGPVKMDVAKRYAESTQTLYKNKNFLFSDEDSSSEIKSIVVEPDIYRKIVRGEHNYIITNQTNFLIGDEIHIIEMSLEKRAVYKTIISIETEDPGLKPGYMVLALAS